MEIRFRNDQVYLLKKHGINSADIEQQLRGFDYNGTYSDERKIKDPRVENTSFPAVNTVFYEYVFLSRCIPSPQELISRYYRFYADALQLGKDDVGYNGETYSRNALEGRLLRTYPSLVRDFHFYIKVVESGCFDSAVYSTTEDIKGKDIIIEHRKKKYVVSLMVDTKRSRFFKRIKNYRRHIYGENEIKLYLDMSKASTVGDFFLYDDGHIDELKKYIL